MMKKKFALILSTILIVYCFPMNVFAIEDISSDVIVEEESLREENVKHFKMPDGSYTAVVYSNPVHRKDSNGVWRDIDNRMNESTVKNKQAYVTADGRAVFSKKINSDDPTVFELSENGYSIKVSFADSNIKNTTAKLSNHATKYVPTGNDDVETQYKKIKTIDNNTTISYKNLLNGMTLEYILSANDIKENIIIEKTQNTYDYSFTYELVGLIALLNEDGAINLLDKNSRELVCQIPAPYMYDEEGEISYDVTYTLTDLENGKYIITVSANSEWINDVGRSFPIVVDPTMTFTKTFIAGTWDTYINSADPDVNYGRSDELWISSNEITFMKYSSLCSIPYDATINYATLNLNYYYYVTSGSLDIGLYLAYVDWTEYTLTWNIANQNVWMGIAPSRLGTATLRATTSITEDTPGLASINVTEIVKAWYAGIPNYGIALKYEDGSNRSVIIKSWEAGSSTRAEYEISYSTEELPLSNGTYFFNNVQYDKYMQIDNNESLSTDGATLELWSYDGASDQKWTLEYLHNEYYKITSSASGKAITAPSEKDDSLTQEDYSASGNQMWKITSAGSGMYKFSPESNASYYMAAGDGIFTSDGRNVEMRSSQSDNKDEWILISTQDISLIALPEEYDRTSFFDSVINEMSEIGYVDYYENKDFVDRGTDQGELICRMANTKITVIRTHGSKTSITTSDGSLTRSEINNMSSSVLNSSELIIYGACLTGSGREGASNLVNATHDRGCSIVIGFEKSVWNTEVNDWCDIFFQTLADGKTVLEACNAADEHIAEEWYNEDEPEYDIRTDSWYIAGDSSTTFS